MANYFQDNNGNFSSMRLIVTVGMAWSMLFTSILIFKEDYKAAIAFFSATATIFKAFKLIQKAQEK